MNETTNVDALKKAFDHITKAIDALGQNLVKLEVDCLANAQALKAILEATPQKESIGDLLTHAVETQHAHFSKQDDPFFRLTLYIQALNGLLPAEIRKKVVPPSSPRAAE